jgi:hypothetical protein
MRQAMGWHFENFRDQKMMIALAGMDPIVPWQGTATRA